MLTFCGITEETVVLTFFFVLNILSHLSQLNTIFQRDNADERILELNLKNCFHH